MACITMALSRAMSASMLVSSHSKNSASRIRPYLPPPTVHSVDSSTRFGRSIVPTTRARSVTFQNTFDRHSPSKPVSPTLKNKRESEIAAYQRRWTVLDDFGHA